MRFSSIFQWPLPLQQSAQSPLRAQEPVVAATPQECPVTLPDQLDERVRLVGEWQLGEG